MSEKDPIEIENVAKRIASQIRTIPDFPKKGIQFKDITPLLLDPKLSKDMLEAMADFWSPHKIEAVAGIESRGFLFGPGLAQLLDIPFVMIRKEGKLPYQKVAQSYKLEYGEATIEVHKDAIKPGERVLIHDDLLATGGTAAASADLIRSIQGEVGGFSFLLELEFLKGRENLTRFNAPVETFVRY